MNKEKIQEIVIAMFNVAGFDTNNGVDTTMAEMKLDSLDEFEMLIEVETQFGIEIPDQKAETFKIINQIVDYIDSL